MKSLLVWIGLVTLAAGWMPVVAQTSRWYLATESQDGEKFFVDRTTLKRVGSLTQAQVFAVYAKSEEDGSVAYVGQHEYDCKAKKVRFVQITTLYDNGATKPDTAEPTWEDVKPETVSEALMKDLCGTR